jgi:hypothetical protein
MELNGAYHGAKIVFQFAPDAEAKTSNYLADLTHG